MDDNLTYTCKSYRNCIDNQKLHIIAYSTSHRYRYHTSKTHLTLSNQTHLNTLASSHAKRRKTTHSPCSPSTRPVAWKLICLVMDTLPTLGSLITYWSLLPNLPLKGSHLEDFCLNKNILLLFIVSNHGFTPYRYTFSRSGSDWCKPSRAWWLDGNPYIIS